MQIDDFKSVIATFADPGTEMLFDKSQIIFSVNGEVIEASISINYGDVLVNDGSSTTPANIWITKRLANLPLLASRLKEMIAPNKNFVSPAAKILQSLETQPDDTVNSSEDALNSTFDYLQGRSPLETSVLYITSDAGEGKTSLINEMAHEQAKRFTEGKVDWLLVPIPLGGRHFLRFDDITVGALQNRYRFPFLYYNSFLALVRMGVIVPAFDGFEEMFVENSSGEALSAMGLLVGALSSTGAVVIAARKAYFEFENLKTQEKLYDTISSYSVGFGKVELLRWTKKQFLEYCNKRNIPNATKIYAHVKERLGEDHSLLTRPVLVKGLVDIASESASLETFLEKVQTSGTDFFSVFVRGIIDREANEKWIDRSGEIGSPLLKVEEHCELLSLVAMEMWEARVNYLKRDLLDFVSDYFCELKRKSSQQGQQIRERLRGHALLVASQNAASAVEFDHDEFRLFFLGEGIAEQLSSLTDRAKAEVLGTLRQGVLPDHSQLAFIRAIKRGKLDPTQAAKFLIDVAALDGQASYTQENCAGLVLRLLNNIDANGLKVANIAFGADALRDCNLTNLTFTNCYFLPSSLESATLINCNFHQCKFGQLRIFKSTTINNSVFEDCAIDGLHLAENNIDIFEPTAVQAHLVSIGVIFGRQQNIAMADLLINKTMDLELHDFGKLLRYFMRSTHISESVILIKLSDRGNEFIYKTLPKLLEVGILREIENRGGNTQRRFALGQSLEKLNIAISSAQGSYSKFISMFTS
ncbi:MAG: hypothetical protein ABL902_00950 [Gallionella sp.]